MNKSYKERIEELMNIWFDKEAEALQENNWYAATLFHRNAIKLNDELRSLENAKAD